MSGDVSPYVGLLTSEHSDQPLFTAMVAAVAQPFADLIAVIQSIPALYDLDVAVGVQLDTVGLWVGISRNLKIALTGVYFSFDTATVGFDQGTWFSQFDPVDGLVSLPDDIYRTLLRARIARNQWDGTIPAAYAIWNTVFAASGAQILIQDNGDMTMLFALVGPIPDALTLALLTGGYLALKPDGVGIIGYMIPSVPSVPLFGFDSENPSISGLDAGGWGTLLPPT